MPSMTCALGALKADPLKHTPIRTVNTDLPETDRWRDTKVSRTQKHSTKRQTVHVTLWMKPEYKAELQRMAGLEGLGVSSFAGTLLEEAVRQKLHIKHAVLLQPIIEQAIAREMRTISTRLAWLL